MEQLFKLAEYAIPALFVILCIKVISVAFESMLIPLLLALIIGVGVFYFMERYYPPKKK